MELKNEREALQMFCDEDSERLLCRKPITIDYKGKHMVMATECHIMALVDAELLHSEYDVMMQRVPNYDYERKDFDKVIELSDIERACQQLLEPEKVSKDGKSEVCPECYGACEVEYEYTDSHGYTYYTDCECPVCDGTGVRKDYELIETGRMIPKKDSTLGLDDETIDARCMWRVVTALRMMGFERMTWKSSQKGANVFDVYDGFVVVIMSRLREGITRININYKKE